MPVPPGTRFRVKNTRGGPIRLAFAGKKVVEAKKMKAKGGKKSSNPFAKKGKGKGEGGPMQHRMMELRKKGSFGKSA